MNYSDSENNHTYCLKEICVKAPARGSRRWRKRQRRIRQGKFKEHYPANVRAYYKNKIPVLDHSSSNLHNDSQGRDTGFAETFLFRIIISIPWRQLPTDECHTLCPSFPLASADSLSRQRSGVNLPEQMPPELFDGVLFFLDERRSGEGPRGEFFRTLRRCQQADRKENDLLDGLSAGSLVCRYWANSCRRSKFSGSLLCVESSDDANILLKYAREGCSSLVPLYTLIGGLSVRQGYDTANSFVHRLHCITQLNREHRGLGVRLHRLTLYGPIPEGFPCHDIATPHWSIPPAVAIPPSLLAFDQALIKDIHFPSFKHVAKYVTHFTRITDVTVTKLTWDESTVTAVSIPRPAKKNPPLDSAYYIASVVISATGCTDNLRLCHYMALARPDCPLHWLPDTGRMIRAMMSLYELYPAGDQSIKKYHIFWERYMGVVLAEHVELSMFVWNNIEDPGHDLYDNADSKSNPKDLEDTHPAFNFIFARQPRDQTPPAIPHLVGCRIRISESDTTPDLINKLALFTERSAAPLVCVTITFADYEKLKTWVWAHPSINAPPPNIHIMYIPSYHRSSTDKVFPHIPLAHKFKKGDCLRIDPVTLEPIRPAWADQYDMEEALYKEIYNL